MTELERVLREIADEFECDVVMGNEFAYYYAENLVVVNPLETEADTFLAFARANGLDKSVSSFVVSFFHEIGHNETIDEVEEEYNGDKDALSFEEYYTLEEEWLATEWAIEFCNENKEIVEKIQKALDRY